MTFWSRKKNLFHCFAKFFCYGNLTEHDEWRMKEEKMKWKCEFHIPFHSSSCYIEVYLGNQGGIKSNPFKITIPE